MGTNLKGPGPGRPKGSVSKITLNIREELEAIGANPALGLAEIAMNPKTTTTLKVKCWEILAKYLYPTKQVNSLQNESNEGFKLQIEWAKDDEKESDLD